MAVHNKSADLNVMFQRLGIGWQFQQQIASEIERQFSYTQGTFTPPNGGRETAQNYAVRRHDELRAATFRKPPELQHEPPAGPQDAIVTGVSPVLKPVAACPARYEPGNPEESLKNYARVKMPRGFSWDGR